VIDARFETGLWVRADAAKLLIDFSDRDVQGLCLFRASKDDFLGMMNSGSCQYTSRYRAGASLSGGMVTEHSTEVLCTVTVMETGSVGRRDA
jgi:hypothetical protein